MRRFLLLFCIFSSACLADEFRSEFIAIHSSEPLKDARIKLTDPVYNIPAWKRADESIESDIFQLAEVIHLTDPEIVKKGDVTHWKFEHEAILIEAERKAGKLTYTFTTRQPGHWSVAYSGAPATQMENVAELFQPLIWNGRRLPEASFLIPDDICSIPGCLVQPAESVRTIGVIADPWQFPYEMPNTKNRKFGVTVRNADGEAQPLVFAPFPGSGSSFDAGDRFQFSVHLVSQPFALSKTFEYVAREICGFRDQRKNTLTTLNKTLDNMADYALSEWAAFDAGNKSSYYPDAKGTVKNVSCLHPLGISLIMDDPRFFHQQAVPIMEYLLSRERFLFAISEEGLGHSQMPSMNLNGPAMPVSELAALHRISRGNSPVFRKAAERLYPVDRRLNMNWMTKGATWQRSLSLYRATGEKQWLTDASEKANLYIAERINVAPVNFEEADDGTFFEYMLPWWKELYELYLDTRDPRHLAAAHAGARRYAQFVWFYPSVPDQSITVNPRGFAPRRGNPANDGPLPVATETVPAWQVSDQGLICEGNGTVQRLGILIAPHAPYFLRIARDTDDGFLREIARSAVIGRYANFPGYHLNTRFSTAQEKPDFPLHSYEELKPTTSMHYNHILPHVNLVIDYLFSRSYDLSNGAIDFPGEFAEGYAYLQGRVYGSQPGQFYDEENIHPWLPKKLLEVDSRQVNFVAGRSDDKLCLAFMNASDVGLEEVTFQLNPERFHGISQSLEARIWQDNQLLPESIQVTDGRGTISLSPKGITAISISGIQPKVQFQKEMSEVKSIPVENIGEEKLGECSVEGSVLAFGPGLRWFYSWLRSDAGKPDFNSVTLTIESGGETREIEDTTFPFEFSVPISEESQGIRYSLKSTRSKR